MSEQRIDRALERAAAMALAPLPIATEGNPFTPPVNGPWAQLFNLRAGVPIATLGEGGQDDHLGIYQIDVNVPESSAQPRPVLLGWVDVLRTAFVAGRLLTHEGQGVRVRNTDISSIRRVDGWLRVSVSVNYSALTTRPEIA